MAVWLWNFWVFSFLGWCLERLFAALTRSPQQRRRCLLLLPLCPVYGLGMAAVLAPARSLSHRLAALCIWRSHRHRRGVPLPLVGRRISGCPVLGLFHCPRNLRGRVCLPFSLAWGIFLFPAVGLAPMVAAMASGIPSLLTWLCLMGFTADAVCSLRFLAVTHDLTALRCAFEGSVNRRLTEFQPRMLVLFAVF